MGPPQMDGEIGLLGLVGHWIGYLSFKKKNTHSYNNARYTISLTSNSHSLLIY